VSKEAFLRRLRRALKGLAPAEIDEIVADYAAHFDEALTAGRSEAGTAAALGDPERLAREHLTDVHYRQWRQQRRAASFVKWLLVSTGLAFLLPCAGLLMLAVPLLAVVLVVALLGGGVMLLSLVPVLAGLLLLLAAGLGAGALVARHRDRLQPFGADGDDVVERELAWSPAQRMQICLPAEVHWKPAAVPRALVRANPWLIEHLRLEGNRLAGRFNWRAFRRNHIEVRLEGPAIAHWAMVGSGDLFLHDVAQQDLHLELDGSGSICATGRVEDVSVAIAGSGDVDIGMLQQARATVEVRGSGDAVVAPSEAADLSIHGSGDIRVLSRPATVRTHVAGSGDVCMA